MKSRFNVGQCWLQFRWKTWNNPRFRSIYIPSSAVMSKFGIHVWNRQWIAPAYHNLTKLHVVFERSVVLYASENLPFWTKWQKWAQNIFQNDSNNFNCGSWEIIQCDWKQWTSFFVTFNRGKKKIRWVWSYLKLHTYNTIIWLWNLRFSSQPWHLIFFRHCLQAYFARTDALKQLEIFK